MTEPAQRARPGPPGTGRYLVAVARGLAPDALDGVVGIGDAPVDVLEHDGLQAVVCTVPLEEYGEDALRQHLEDMAWLEALARRHNDVVWAVAGAATVAPMRLVTIYADDDGVRRRLDEVGDGLRRALDSVEGRREWSVKVFALQPDPGRPGPEDAGAAPAAASGAGSGAAYLQRKRAGAERRRAAGDRSAAVADTVHRALVEGAVASRVLPPQDPRLTGRREPMVLNAAYLVADEDADAFRGRVDELATGLDDARVEVEGPWPPYSFATLDQA